MMHRIVPLSAGHTTTLLQFIVPMPFVFCCGLNPVEGDGQETIAVFVLVMEIASEIAPGLCTSESSLQKPPVRE